MKLTQIIMGMPVTVEIVDANATKADLNKIFDYFRSIDERFSTYKPGSEISKINKGQLEPRGYSHDMQTVLKLCEEIKTQSHGFFDIKKPDGTIDPSGLVKGWAIKNAADILSRNGFKNFYVEAGGDIQANGLNNEGRPWRVGIKNPFNQTEIIKVVEISNMGMATSGTYERGQHIYNPKNPGRIITDIVSLTVVGPDVYQADCFATAAFAMTTDSGRDAIIFIEKINNLEGYMVNKNGIATMTTGFEKYVKNN